MKGLGKESSDGHGSCCAGSSCFCAEACGGEDEILSLSAKDWVGGWGDFAARSAKGLALPLDGEDVAKGFACGCEKAENGLLLLEDGGGEPPNNWLPKLCCGFDAGVLSSCFGGTGLLEIFAFFTSLNTRTLPGFLEHCFFLQHHTNSLRSSSGKCCCKSACNCSNNDI